MPASFGPDEIAQRAQQGWRLVAIEWEREIPKDQAVDRADQVPFGLQISTDAQRLEENPTEQEILRLMMELTVQDGPYSAIAEELNQRGYRTREGMKWTAVSVFQMLPRLIEVGPKIFSSREWQERREHFAKPN
jgi:hypothetical protein